MLLCPHVNFISQNLLITSNVKYCFYLLYVLEIKTYVLNSFFLSITNAANFGTQIVLVTGYGPCIEKVGHP